MITHYIISIAIFIEVGNGRGARRGSGVGKAEEQANCPLVMLIGVDVIVDMRGRVGTHSFLHCLVEGGVLPGVKEIKPLPVGKGVFVIVPVNSERIIVVVVLFIIFVFFILIVGI